MGFEIERKFLLRNDNWKNFVTRRIPIRQCYLATDGKASIRVRIRNEETATLTVKSRPVDVRRLELQYPVPMLEAEAMMQLRHGDVVEKTRHIVPQGDLNWEIDVFSGENSGLVIAEIELQSEDQHVDLPEWIGAEVTGKREYYNSYLVRRPFRSWPAPTEPAELLA